MKILVQANIGRIGDGIASSLSWVPDFYVSVWSREEKPIMDMFDEVSPDFLIVTSDVLDDKAFKIASGRYPQTKIISVGEVNNSTGAHLSICKKGSPHLPSIVFEDGAMLGRIGSPAPEPSLASDVLCITDYIEGNSEEIGILQFLCSNYNTKIFGNLHVSVPSYLGIVSDQVRASAMASTRVYVDLDGGSHYDLEWLRKNTISKFENILDLKSKIDAALKKGDQEIYRISVKNQTYFDLCSQILGFFGLEKESAHLIKKKGELS